MNYSQQGGEAKIRHSRTSNLVDLATRISGRLDVLEERLSNHRTRLYGSSPTPVNPPAFSQPPMPTNLEGLLERFEGQIAKLFDTLDTID